jgi:hypothetical protein
MRADALEENPLADRRVGHQSPNGLVQNDLVVRRTMVRQYRRPNRYRMSTRMSESSFEPTCDQFIRTAHILERSRNSPQDQHGSMLGELPQSEESLDLGILVPSQDFASQKTQKFQGSQEKRSWNGQIAGTLQSDKRTHEGY